MKKGALPTSPLEGEVGPAEPERVGGPAAVNVRAGLIATQGIRFAGANRRTLDRIAESGAIFFGIADRDWILDGATVHISTVGFDDGTEKDRTLDGKPCISIYTNLTTGDSFDSTTAKPLTANAGRCFIGVMKAGDFDIDEGTALSWLREPNPHGKPNSDVLRPRLTARDLLQRAEVGWIIDFGCDSDSDTACLYQGPWKHIETVVKPTRIESRDAGFKKYFWQHGRPRPELRTATANLHRVLITPEVSKHRVFAWLEDVYLPDQKTRVFAVQDEYTFGVLHSKIHEKWALAQGSQLRDMASGFSYTPTTCFETFPFPAPTDAQREAVAAAAKELDTLRNAWLNPPEWTRTETLEFPGSADGPWKRYVTNPNLVGIGTVRYPRVVPQGPAEAALLKNRTLTKLYNERPAWLANAHRKLDEAVSAAYGWPPTLTDDQLLAKLLALNLARAGA